MKKNLKLKESTKLQTFDELTLKESSIIWSTPNFNYFPAKKTKTFYKIKNFHYFNPYPELLGSLNRGFHKEEKFGWEPELLLFTNLSEGLKCGILRREQFGNWQ